MKTKVKRISPGIVTFKNDDTCTLEHNSIQNQFKFLQMQSMIKETLIIQAIHIWRQTLPIYTSSITYGDYIRVEPPRLTINR